MGKGFDGLCVMTFENRLADRMSMLIGRLGGKAISAPAVRELPAPQSPDAATFAKELLADKYDTVVLPTGHGAAALMAVMEQHHSQAALVDALSRTNDCGPRSAGGGCGQAMAVVAGDCGDRSEYVACDRGGVGRHRWYRRPTHRRSGVAGSESRADRGIA